MCVYLLREKLSLNLVREVLWEETAAHVAEPVFAVLGEAVSDVPLHHHTPVC